MAVDKIERCAAILRENGLYVKQIGDKCIVSNDKFDLNILTEDELISYTKDVVKNRTQSVFMEGGH